MNHETAKIEKKYSNIINNNNVIRIFFAGRYIAFNISCMTGIRLTNSNNIIPLKKG